VIGLTAVLAPSSKVKHRRAVFVAHLAAAVGLAIVAEGCGRTGLDPGGGAASGLGRSATGGADGGGAGSGGGAGAGRVPMNHRVSGSACPAVRGAGPSFDQCVADGGPPLGMDCQYDVDCLAGGVNGRCLGGVIFGPCVTGCSYDQCFMDADCGARVPCTCRSTAMDPGANFCETGSNCAVDGDCGPGGYCSPSLVERLCVCLQARGDACGHGYYCHTAGDECIDDADCSDGQTCNYAVATGTWTCSECWPIP